MTTETELDGAFAVREYLRMQLQRAQARHFNKKEIFFQDLLDKQDKVIDYMEKT